MYLWAPFIVQNSKKHFQSQFRVSRMFHFWVRNDPFALNTFVLVQTIIITIIYLLALSVSKIFKKILPAAPESWGHTILESKTVPLSQTNFFFGKNYEHYFHISTGPFYCEKFLKNSYSGSRVMKMHHFLGHKWLICNNENFFQKTC